MPILPDIPIMDKMFPASSGPRVFFQSWWRIAINRPQSPWICLISILWQGVPHVNYVQFIVHAQHRLPDFLRRPAVFHRQCWSAIWAQQGSASPPYCLCLRRWLRKSAGRALRELLLCVLSNYNQRVCIDQDMPRPTGPEENLLAAVFYVIFVKIGSRSSLQLSRNL